MARMRVKGVPGRAAEGANRRRGASPVLVSPIATWFEDERAIEQFRALHLGQGPAILPPRNDAWGAVAPGFGGAVALAASGVPFQVVAERRYNRSADPRRLRRALAKGETVFLPQAHQVLPRIARLMVALRAALMGPLREECSFLFVVNGTGRPGMGLHHDGDVDAFWLQLEGRRTVTVGPPVPEGTPEDLDDRLMGRGRRSDWWTTPLEPGSLLYLPPRTPHCVVCHEPSLALSLTWKELDPREAMAAALDGLDPPSLPQPRGSSLGAFREMVAGAVGRTGARAWARAAARAYAIGLTAWNVAPGRPVGRRHKSRQYLWTQVPAVPLSTERRRGQFRLWTPHGTLWLPAAARPLADELATMPSFSRDAAGGAKRALAALLNGGIVAPHDLPLRIVPKDPASLDGWNFA